MLHCPVMPDEGELGFLVAPERPRERMVPPMQATVFKAASKKRSKTAFFRQLPALVSRPFQCRMASSKTPVFIDTHIFPSRLVLERDRPTGIAEPRGVL